MTDDFPRERRSGQAELAVRIASLEKAIADVSARSKRYEDNFDELLKIAASGRLALRIIFWLGTAVVSLTALWQWVVDHVIWGMKP